MRSYSVCGWIRSDRQGFFLRIITAAATATTAIKMTTPPMMTVVLMPVGVPPPPPPAARTVNVQRWRRLNHDGSRHRCRMEAASIREGPDPIGREAVRSGRGTHEIGRGRLSRADSVVIVVVDEPVVREAVDGVQHERDGISH